MLGARPTAVGANKGRVTCEPLMTAALQTILGNWNVHSDLMANSKLETSCLSPCHFWLSSLREKSGRNVFAFILLNSAWFVINLSVKNKQVSSRATLKIYETGFNWGNALLYRLWILTEHLLLKSSLPLLKCPANAVQVFNNSNKQLHVMI